MRRFIFALLLMSLAVHAGIAQSYEQTVKRDGSSVIVKSMDINLFAAELGENALEGVSVICNESQAYTCSVEGDRISMSESFSAGPYYSFKTEYGVFNIDYTLVVSKVPTDRFSRTLDQLLDEADILESEGESSEVLDLLDSETNSEAVGYLRRFDSSLSYRIIMPAPITEAHAGNVTPGFNGNTVQFDLVDVMAESKAMTVKSSELNMANMIIIGAILVLGALALSFFKERPKKKGK
ncbi:hypothetical protein GF318_05975 [Candidatus Micrarchaeota archaeon]|nr:hypothetical protein [Candidatus Micrarchaeota archaeon]